MLLNVVAIAIAVTAVCGALFYVGDALLGVWQFITSVMNGAGSVQISPPEHTWPS
jgi:Flp pilus assembly pilin Flp